ncbi:TlpA family protein disulfide reductase [Microbacterium sp. YY-03]|uniref:TlpA family protein disulfide reductase n=1 Tax=Microbacterium sp. YY-03 TaxID=3421636 RepID=UPI003D1680BF
MTSRMKKTIATLVAAGAILTLSACTQSDPATEQFLNNGNAGYISDTYQVVEIPAEERGEPVAFAGETEYGDAVSSEDLQGEVVVVNFWFAACGPCRVEAPILEEVYQEYKDAGATFLGVNTSDLADTAKSFADTYGVTYPSLMDVKTGEVELAFAAVAPMTATPTTVILDKQGRPAARIIGAVPDASILSTIVRELTEES